MDVLECVSISTAEDAPLLERFYNELMIPNFPLKEVSRGRGMHNEAGTKQRTRTALSRTRSRSLALPRTRSDVRRVRDCVAGHTAGECVGVLM